MTQLDLNDIQGNIVKAYGRFGFPKARFIFYRVRRGNAGRRFVEMLSTTITTAAPWSDGASIPKTVTNIAFTYQGLKALGVPDSTLHEFPDEFSMGMRRRRDILGDNGPSAPRCWDPIWNSDEADAGSWSSQVVHIMVSINARSQELLEGRYGEICDLLRQVNQEMCSSDGSLGVEQLYGHKDELGADATYQDASALYDGDRPIPKEHFGYTDGISDPYFDGSGADPVGVIGGGKPTGKDPRTLAGWEPLATGEFVLGYPDESQANSPGPKPPLFSRNGTFMVYRKLHQNVGAFNALLEERAKSVPKSVAKDLDEAKEYLAAKFSGRWRNGAPLVNFPTKAEADAFISELMVAKAKAERDDATEADKRRALELAIQLNAFDYDEDLDGSRCPRGAHIRRTNPRSSLEFSKGAFATPGGLSNRRRVLRRGLPYGAVVDPSRNDGNHGIIIMILNADIGRQFEFVQQQWMNFGNDFRLANDRDPLLGNHGVTSDGTPDGRMTIEGDMRTGKPPMFLNKMPRLVETRGGDYFFIPSMTCVRMIAHGIVDPT